MKEKEWYDDPGLITNMLIGLLILIIIISQSVAIRHQLGLGFMVRSLLNYNSIYIIFLAYFILLKTKFGKRNFNILNICLVFIQMLVLLAALLNIFQAFNLSTIVNLILNTSVFIYMLYVLLKGTPLWSNCSLDKVPFNKLTNKQYFYGISAISLILLIVGLFRSFTFDGVVLSLLEAMFTIGWARYLYLYQDFKEAKDKVEVKEEIKKEAIKEEAVTKPKKVVKKTTNKKTTTTSKKTTTKKKEVKKDE